MGLVHLIVGPIVLAAGFGVISGAAWARWLGIIFVSIQAVTNFLFILVQPFGRSLTVIDLWIIHSLFVHRREPVQPKGSGVKLRTNYGPHPPSSAHLNGQPWTLAGRHSLSTTVKPRSGGQGVASSNLASPTKQMI